MATRSALKNALVGTALTLVSVGICLALAEGALRLITPAGYFIHRPHVHQIFAPAPGVMPGVSGESVFRTNSRGLRATELEPQHVYRVLTLGGSTTECLYLDQSEAWPQVLETQLNASANAPRTWVGNGGISGRTSRHHLTALQYLPLEEMAIDTVVVLMGINDMAFRLSQGDAYDPRSLGTADGRRKAVEEAFSGMQLGQAEDPWFKRTLLWQALRRVKQSMSGRARAGMVQDRAGEIYDTWRRHRQQATAILPALPDLGDALREYQDNIERMAELARQRKLRLILLSQPTMWRADLPMQLQSLLWFGGVGDFQNRAGLPYYSIDAMARGMAQYNSVLLDSCRKLALECIDLGALEQDTSVFYDDVHFNESGARKVADLVARHLRTAPPFDGRAR